MVVPRISKESIGMIIAFISVWSFFNTFKTIKPGSTAIEFTNPSIMYSYRYPTTVPPVKVRVDSESGKTVERGKLELLGGVTSFTATASGSWDVYSKKVPFTEFRRVLQCSPDEPDLDGSRGIISLMRLLGVTKDSILLGCAYAESRKACLNWPRCRKHLENLLSGTTKPSTHFDLNIRLVRVMNGRLYYDWPWNIGRFNAGTDWSMARMIGGVLEKISDMPDSVFFTRSWDLALFPGHFPIPALSHGPTTQNADIPFPWTPIIAEEIHYHMEQIVKGTQLVPDLNPKYDNIWNGRISKVAFFGTLFGDRPAAVARQVLMDLAVLRPDLIEARFGLAHSVFAYSPESREEMQMSDLLSREKSFPVIEKSNTSKPGFLEHSKHLFTNSNIHINEYMRKYKYLIVLAGSGSSGRLSTFLSRSGAVILLQQTDYLYHFSMRLIPWVHYVPITFTAADVISKVLWLQEHDNLARQIAINGRAFADSYLRLEDYYCYVSSALKAFAEVANKSALEPFNPQPFLTADGLSRDRDMSKKQKKYGK